MANSRCFISVSPRALQVLAACISAVADSCNRGKIHLQLSYLNHWDLDTTENLSLSHMLFLLYIETRLEVMGMDCTHCSVCSWGANKMQAFKTKQFNGAVWLCNITCALASCKTLQRTVYGQ